MKNLMLLLAAGALAFVLAGCPAAKEAKKEETAPPKPELTITVASLNLASLNKRIERKDVAALARLLKHEQIEVLAVQSVTRYPGLETRIDLVNELAAKTDMRKAFGEIVNSGGRQTGNAVFSSYPLRNNINIPFSGIKSAAFDAALAAIVDGGVRDIIVISAQLPSRASQADVAACVEEIKKQVAVEQPYPIIVSGNLPSPGEDGPYKEFRIPKHPSSRIWYVEDAGLSVLSSRIVETDLGPMAVFQFGVFRQMGK